MARQKNLGEENKKQLILRVATEIFAAKGFNEATIAEIARQANISEGSIYDYFKNKEDLLFSIPEERMEHFLFGLKEHLEGIQGALAKLRKLIWYHLNFYEKNKDYVLILLQNIHLNPRFYATRAYYLIREFSKLVAQIIEEGKKENSLRADLDSLLVRDALLGAIEHITIRGSILGRFPNLTKAAEPLYEIFVAGIQKESGTITIPLKDFYEIQKSLEKSNPMRD